MEFADGTKKTLGIMMPGEYEFGTDVKEIMEILAGDLKVLLPGDSEWITISGKVNLQSRQTRNSSLR